MKPNWRNVMLIIGLALLINTSHGTKGMTIELCRLIL